MRSEYHEKQILPMLMSGMSNQEISRILGIEIDAVKQHMRAILAKLQNSNTLARACAHVTRPSVMM